MCSIAQVIWQCTVIVTNLQQYYRVATKRCTKVVESSNLAEKGMKRQYYKHQNILAISNMES